MEWLHTILAHSPGWTWTGMTGANAGTPKPDGAWTPEETVRYVRNYRWMQLNDYAIPRYMFDSVCQGDFYIICPDNETCVLLYASTCCI